MILIRQFLEPETDSILIEGNLSADIAEGITSIDWTVYGKVSRVVKNTGQDIRFAYNAAGQRVRKEVYQNGQVQRSYYVHDAGGNVLAIYAEEAIDQQEMRMGKRHLISLIGPTSVEVQDLQCQG